ncbi:glycoside hydrolase, family 39 [Sarocladium strictum]
MSNHLHASATAAPVAQLKPFWSQVVGAGRANEGLRADWQHHLKLVSSACGFRYVRFHGLYHDDMHVVAEVDGQHVYNFQYIDALFDAMLDLGVRPFVEFGFCPSPIATVTDTVFWWKGHASPPKEIGHWYNLVDATVKHWIDRYGIEEVRTWYFECWNEPNLHPFFKGTRSQYYELYETTVKAVKGIDASLRVGGPATSNFVPDSRFDDELEDFQVQMKLKDVEDIDSLNWQPVWVKHFLEWCSSKNLPVDFVSCHPYPTDWALDTTGAMSKKVREVQATPKDLALLRKMVSESAYPEAEIHLTEWSSSPSSRDHAHDEVPAAIFVARTLLASLGLVDTLAYWTFTDVFEEEGAGLTPFHGGFGLVNLQGIPKPAFHTFRLLRHLGAQVLQRHDDNGIITRDEKTNLLQAVLLHYPPELKTSPPPAYLDRQAALDVLKIGQPVTKKLSLDGLPSGAPFRVEKLAPGGRGDPAAAWRRMGEPDTLSREATRELISYAEGLDTRYVNADEDGRLVFIETMAPWTLITLTQLPLR